MTDLSFIYDQENQTYVQCVSHNPEHSKNIKTESYVRFYGE